MRLHAIGTYIFYAHLQPQDHCLVQILIGQGAQLVHTLKIPVWLNLVSHINDFFKKGHVRLCSSMPVNSVPHTV